MRLSLFRQFLVVLALLAIVVGGFALYDHYRGEETSAAQNEGRRGGRSVTVEVTAAETRTLRSVVEAVGSTRAAQAIDVVPLASGRISALPFEPGQEVQAGAVLVAPDDTMSRAALREARARLRQAELALERARKLRANRNIAQSTVDEATAAAETAQAQVEAAEKELADRTVRAPFTGTVGMRNVDLGAFVATGTVVTTLDDLSRVEVEFSVPETAFGAVRTGQKIVARAAAYPGRTFEGSVTGIDSRIATGSRAFKIRAAIPNADRALPAGMFLFVEVELAEREALMVPEEALQASAAGSFLFVVEDGRAVRQNVEVGQRQGGLAEITAGVSAGEKVVISGLQRLRDGIAVEIAREEPATNAVPAGGGAAGA